MMKQISLIYNEINLSITQNRKVKIYVSYQVYNSIMPKNICKGEKDKINIVHMAYASLCKGWNFWHSGLRLLLWEIDSYLTIVIKI